MKVLCIDDEPLALKLLDNILKNKPGIEELYLFENAKDALACAKDIRFDVAFVDIMMGNVNGLDFAQDLREINPSCKIIYCTGYAQYAIDSINRGVVDGYLLKPVEDTQVQRILDRFNIKEIENEPLITVKEGVGQISVFDQKGQPVVFGRKKTQQLFRILLECNGGSMSTDELCERLWTHKGTSVYKNRQYLYVLTGDLNSVLKEHNASELFTKTFDGYVLDISRIKIM